MTCDFQQCGILTSVDSDEPLQPPSKLRNSKWCLAVVEYLSDKQSLWPYCVYAQADLRLYWSHIVTMLLEILCHGSLLCNFYSQPFVWTVYIHSLKFQISGKNAKILPSELLEQNLAVIPSICQNSAWNYSGLLNAQGDISWKRTS